MQAVLLTLFLCLSAAAAPISEATRQHLDILESTAASIRKTNPNSPRLDKIEEEINRIKAEFGLSSAKPSGRTNPKPSSQRPAPEPKQWGQADTRQDGNTSEMRQKMRETARKFARAPVQGGEGLGLAEAEAENFASIWANSPGKNGPLLEQFAKYRTRFKKLMDWALDPSETGGRKTPAEAAEYANNYARLKAFTLDDQMLEEYLREVRAFAKESYRQPTVKEITERAYKYAKTPWEKRGLGYSEAKAQEFASYWHKAPSSISDQLGASYERYESSLKDLIEWAISPKGQGGGGKTYKDLKPLLPDWQFQLYMALSTGGLEQAVEKEKLRLRPDWPKGCDSGYSKFR